MTEFEKIIYNTFLETSKKVNNKPVRYRKDFTKFEENENYIYINKLSAFFTKFKHINVKDFFEAPYFVYDENYFDLKFYCSHKAIKTYTAYNDNYILNNPDDPNTLLKLKESISFIYDFCKSKNIKPQQYINHIEGNYNSFFKHIKERSINFYIIFSFPGIDQILNNYDNEIKGMFSSNFSKINYLRTKFYASGKAKKIINKFKEYVETQ